MNFDDNKVLILELVSGESVVGLMERDETHKSWKVTLPMQVGVQASQGGPAAGGNFSVQMAPFRPLLPPETPAHITDGVVAVYYKPSPELVEKYKHFFLKQTSSLYLPDNVGGLTRA